MEHKIVQLYKSDNFYFFLLGGLGFFMGTKTCDLIFYDEQKYVKIRESMED